MRPRPPVRLVPPSPSQLQGLPDPLWTVEFPAEVGADAPAAALRLPYVREASVVRVTSTRSNLLLLADAMQAGRMKEADLLRRALSPPRWRLRTVELPMDWPHVMGIVNLTDDSFSGDGVGTDPSGALRRAEELRAAGATLIDVGAETARADRPVLDAEAEAKVVATAVAALAREGHVVSSDTYKPLVARAALDSGAEVVNDISGLTLGLGAAAEAARAGAGYVLNYSYSVPKRRPDAPPLYADVVAETVSWMFERLAELEASGLPFDQICVDPGIAFGKSHDEDIQILRRLGELRSCGRPILLAHSRKNFIGSVTGRVPAERDLETHAASALAFAQGARIFRVHDAAGARRALDLAAALTTAQPGDFAPGPESWPWASNTSAAHMTTAAPDKEPPKGQRW
ncbi:MAG: dihydropteroate synthase [Dehalococcoidia bacterium]